MPIRIKCSKCQAALAVKDSLAGKKVSCPKCRNQLAIPAPKVTATSTTSQSDADAEAEALKTFGEETAKPVVATKFIEIECAFCMEMVKVSAELAGKQTPCPNPECKRIIKVPMLKQEKPKDWRQVNPRIAGGLLKTDAKEPEGVWGTAQTTRVSTEALIEADAIPVKKVPVTRATWIKRGAYLLVAIIAIGAGTWGVLGWMESGKVQGSLNNALEQVKSNSRLKPPAAASILRSAGQFRLASGDSEAAKKHFDEARFKLGNPVADGKLDIARDMVVIDLALAWMDLSEQQGSTDSNLDWSQGVRQTLVKIGSNDAKLTALRRIADRLRTKGQIEKALVLATQLVPADAPAKPAEPTLPDEKKDQADKVKPPDIVRSPLVSQQIALLIATGKMSEAAKIEPPPSGKDKDKEIDLVTRLGYAEGMARLDKFTEAREIAKLKGQDIHRLEASVAIAAIANANKRSAQAKENAQDALAIFNDLQNRKQPVGVWLTVQLARVCAQAGLTSEAKKAADAISSDEETEAKALAQLETLIVLLESSTGPVPTNTVNEYVTVKGTLGQFLALESVARHNTKLGARSQALGMLEGLDDAQKAFVWVGVAVGSVAAKSQ